MTLEVYLVGLFIVSTLTGLFTEAIKILLEERGKTYHANALVGCIAIIVALLVSVAYIIITNKSIAAETIVHVVSLIILSWLCAMLGYDKVIQAISQFKKIEKQEE